MLIGNQTRASWRARQHSWAAGSRQPTSGNRSTQEDLQGMANVEDDNTPAPSGGVITAVPEREKRGDRGGMKTLVRDDDDQIDPAEYARLLDSYDTSFRNIAEGEVVKG